MLTVLCKVSSNRNGSITWRCKCDCGKIVIYSSDHLIRKNKPVRSCGCFRKRSGNQHKDFKGYGEIPLTWWSTRIIRELVNKSRRKRIKVEINIEDAWSLFLKQNRRCALSGLELTISNTNHKNTASIDRIDSSKGYLLDNIQWVHKHINFMKRTYSQNYFIEMCEKVAEKNQENIEIGFNKARSKLGW